MTRKVLQQALEAWQASAYGTVQHHKAMLVAMTDVGKAILAQPYPEYDRGFSNGWDKCAARQVTQPDNTSKLYEELRSIIDSGSESFTHADAVQYLKDNLAPLEWTPEDTAYRPGGLAQPEHPGQMARLGWQYFECPACGSEGARAFPKPEQKPEAWLFTDEEGTEFFDQRGDWEGKGEPLYISPPKEQQSCDKRQPLADEQIEQIYKEQTGSFVDDSPWALMDFSRAIEAAHDIGEKT